MILLGLRCIYLLLNNNNNVINPVQQFKTKLTNVDHINTFR